MGSIKFSLSVDDRGIKDRFEDLLGLVSKKERITKKVGEVVRDEAKKRAPVDTGKLEENIRVEKRGGVTSVISDASEGGDNYALRLHESDTWNLGPKSREKDKRQPEKVGPRWLTRAVNENENKLNEASIQEAKDILLSVNKK